MANCTNILLLMLSLIFTATLLSTTTATAKDDAYPSVFYTPPFQFSLSDTSYVANVLSTLGFQQLADASLNLTMITTPVTIFAPSASSLRNCLWCDARFILKEYSMPGLYTFDAIAKLPLGTTRPNFVPNRCLTVTSFKALNTDIVFVNGLQIIGPDVYNDGLVIVHALYGDDVRHLPPNSCSVAWYVTFMWRMWRRFTTELAVLVFGSFYHRFLVQEN